MNVKMESSTICDPHLLRALLDEVSDAVYIIDPETGKFLDANRCAWQCLGYSRIELLTMSIADIVPAAVVLESNVEYLQRLKKRGTITLERLHKRKDKTTFPVEVRLSLSELDEEEYVIAVARDITERKQAEETQRVSHERLEKVIDLALDAVIVMDHKGLTTLWNSAAEKMFGFSASDVIGKNCYDLIMPDHYLEQCRHAFELFQKTGTGAAVGNTVELEAMRKGGETFPVELSIAAVPLGDEMHAVGIVRDISDRVQQDRRFQSTVFRYMAMLDTVPALVYLKDIHHKYMAANKAFCDNIRNHIRRS